MLPKMVQNWSIQSYNNKLIEQVTKLVTTIVKYEGIVVEFEGWVKVVNNKSVSGSIFLQCGKPALGVTKDGFS